MCTFYSLQLSHKHLLDKERCGRIKNAFSTLREKLSYDSRIRCLKFFISDLNFINSFSLTGEIHFNSLFYLLVEICRDFKENNSLPNNYSKLLSPYRQRFVDECFQISVFQYSLSDFYVFLFF